MKKEKRSYTHSNQKRYDKRLAKATLIVEKNKEHNIDIIFTLLHIYTDGIKIRDIATLLNISTSNIDYRLKKIGIKRERRKPYMSPIDWERIK